MIGTMKVIESIKTGLVLCCWRIAVAMMRLIVYKLF